jgi:hypothetical protein
MVELFLVRALRMRLELEALCCVLLGTCALCDDDGVAGDLMHVMQGKHSCAVTDQGGLKCWGSNSRGQVMLRTDLFFLFLISALAFMGD